MKNGLAINKTSQPGQLSVFPADKDSVINLHYAVNKAQDSLRQTLPVNGKYIILNNSDKFPDSGIIKIIPPLADNLLNAFEVIYYGRKIGDQLHLLHRGYNKSTPMSWPAGSKVTCPLMAEHHNAIKDAIFQIQKKVGLEANPTPDSINGIMNYLKHTWLSPQPVFRAYPRMGTAPLTVTFHNFSKGINSRYLWDFGDGYTSSEEHPIHRYDNEGTYTVRLIMVSSDKSQGLTEKANYITVDNEQLPAFFYANPLQGLAKDTEFSLVDQSDGDIVERHWFFGDSNEITISNPNIHEVKHKYDRAGTFLPSLVIRLADNKTRRIFLPEGIEVV